MNGQAHFVNLTRGLLCGPVTEPHYIRIQSTWCEQKRWADVLATVGPDFLFHLATTRVVVHDVSEKPRTTRALWQGLPWIKYACERTWGIEPTPVRSRNGMNVTAYFADAYASLDDRLVRQVAYFNQFRTRATLDVSTCQRSLALMGRAA